MSVYRFFPRTNNKWLDLVQETNRLAQAAGEEAVFGTPTKLCDPPYGGEDRSAEEYPEARILFALRRNDDGTRVIGHTERASKWLDAAAKNLDLPEARLL